MYVPLGWHINLTSQRSQLFKIAFGRMIPSSSLNSSDSWSIGHFWWIIMIITGWWSAFTASSSEIQRYVYSIEGWNLEPFITSRLLTHTKEVHECVQYVCGYSTCVGSGKKFENIENFQLMICTVTRTDRWLILILNSLLPTSYFQFSPKKARRVRVTEYRHH